MQNNHSMAKNRPARSGQTNWPLPSCPTDTYDKAKLAEWGDLIPSSQLPQGWQKALKPGPFK